jgi:hypothetical protein
MRRSTRRLAQKNTNKILFYANIILFLDVADLQHQENEKKSNKSM